MNGARQTFFRDNLRKDGYCLSLHSVHASGILPIRSKSGNVGYSLYRLGKLWVSRSPALTPQTRYNSQTPVEADSLQGFRSKISYLIKREFVRCTQSSVVRTSAAQYLVSSVYNVVVSHFKLPYIIRRTSAHTAENQQASFVDRCTCRIGQSVG